MRLDCHPVGNGAIAPLRLGVHDSTQEVAFREDTPWFLMAIDDNDSTDPQLIHLLQDFTKRAPQLHNNGIGLHDVTNCQS